MKKNRLRESVDPFTNKKIRCERGIANDWQVPKEYKATYEAVAKEMKVLNLKQLWPYTKLKLIYS